MAAKLKKTVTELNEKTIEFMQGEITLTGLVLFLIGLDCLLLGICIGFLKAPLTHGITIGSYNGNNENKYGDVDCDNDESDLEEEL